MHREAVVVVRCRRPAPSRPTPIISIFAGVARRLASGRGAGNRDGKSDATVNVLTREVGDRDRETVRDRDRETVIVH